MNAPPLDECEPIYVCFWRDYPEYGRDAGDIVRAWCFERDNKGVHVRMRSANGALFQAWSDLASFVEIPPLEVLALAAADRLPFDE